MNWIRRHQDLLRSIALYGTLLLLLAGCVVYGQWSKAAGVVLLAASGVSLVFPIVLSVIVQVHDHIHKRVRIYVLDLIILVAVLGNSVAWVATRSDVWKPFVPEVKLFIVGFCCVLVALWILIGAGWGLWVATARQIEKPLARVWLMIVGWIFPLAFVGFMSGFTAIGAIGMKDYGIAALFFLQLVVSVLFVFYVRRLHVEARKCERERLEIAEWLHS